MSQGAQGAAPVGPGELFGAALRRSRAARGWTLHELAERLRGAGHSCTKSYLSELENARRPLPTDEFIAAAENVLRLPPGTLTDAARWERTPEPVRAQMHSLESQRRIDQRQKQRFLQRFAQILAATSTDQAGAMRGQLDAAFRSGELQRWVEELEGASPGDDPARPSPVSADPAQRPATLRDAPVQAGPLRTGPLRPVTLAQEVPLINSVAAGYPREFTDLGYPARVADQYVRVPDIADADAFAARVVGDSMAPSYLEGDIVVFSPAKDVRDGADCFARLEPDQQTTFKRVYFQRSEGGDELIRLQPINPAYPPRTLPRDQVSGLYAAVTVMRRVG